MQHEDDKNKWPDARLFRAAGQGDEEAFVILARRCTYIVRFLRALCQANRIPEGVATTLALQTVRIAVAESIVRPIPATRPDRWNWLQEIAQREFRGWVADNRRVLRKPPAAGSGQSARAASTGGPSADCVGKYMKWLSDDRRDMIEMVFLKGMTVEAAGKTIGWDARRSLDEYIEAHRMIADCIKQHGCD
jgi:hypothetical protein